VITKPEKNEVITKTYVSEPLTVAQPLPLPANHVRPQVNEVITTVVKEPLSVAQPVRFPNLSVGPQTKETIATVVNQPLSVAQPAPFPANIIPEVKPVVTLKPVNYMPIIHVTAKPVIPIDPIPQTVATVQTINAPKPVNIHLEKILAEAGTLPPVLASILPSVKAPEPCEKPVSKTEII
jgi:hypothetical protein